MQAFLPVTRCFVLFFFVSFTLSNAQTFPTDTWETADPALQNVDPAELENAVNYLKGQAGRDSCKELVIVKNGYVIWQGENSNNIHGVWSIAKSFTSTVLGLLIDDEKCSLETHASKYVPSLSAYYADVTLKHFATMKM